MTAKRSFRRRLINATIVLALLTATRAAAQPAASTCSSVAYRGFDSRLDVELVARVDVGEATVTGFEIAGSRPVVAFERRLIGIDGGRLLSMPSIERIDRLAVDADGRLWLQHGRKVRRLGKDKLDTVRELAEGAHLYNSGHVLFLESAQVGANTRLALRSADAQHSLPPVELQGGKLASASWNAVGMSAIAGASLVTWPAGAKTITRLREDDGLRSARDVTLVSGTRAVVALPNTLALVTDRGIAALALIRARVRWANGALFVLDETWGGVWKVTGLERIGGMESDKAHAAAIMNRMPAGSPETHPAFLEAARIVGCDGARQLVRKRR